MSRLRKTKPKADNLLTGQKPILPQRKKTALLRKILKGFGIGVAVMAVGYLGYLGIRHRDAVTSFIKNEDPVAWDVRFNGQNPKPLAPELQQAIAKELQAAIPTDRHELFAAAAHELQKKHGAKQIHLLRTGPREISVAISFREPIMRVEADKERFLSTEGDIYGPDSRTSEDLPLLTGVFATKDVIPFKENGTVELTKEQQGIVDEAATLLKDLRRSRIEVTEIQYAAYRGFTPLLKAHQLEVTLGRAPFDKKISRLNEILLKLEQKGLTASKIELDYEGKAFIKEKKF